MTEKVAQLDHPTEAEAAAGRRRLSANLYDRLIEVPVSLILIAMVLHVSANALLRALAGHPLDNTLEYTQFWYLPAIVFAGFLTAARRGEHIRASLIFDNLPSRLQRPVWALVSVVSATLSGGFAYYSLLEALDNREKGLTGGVSTVVIWPVTFIVPLMFALLALQFLADALRAPRAEMVEIGEQDTDLVSVDSLSVHDEASTPARRWRTTARESVAVTSVVLAIACTVAIFLPLIPEAIGTAAVVLMLLLIFLRLPVGYALVLPAVLGLRVLASPLAVENLLGKLAWDSSASWSLSVIPMFVFMGLLLWRSGLTTELFGAARQWLSWLPGGLAIGTNAAGVGLASISGSTAASTYALSRIGISEMLKAGYDKRVAIGSVVVAGLPGQLIPPSVMLVIYAGIAEVPVGEQLMAGVVPGILIAVVCGLMLMGLFVTRPSFAGTGEVSDAEPISWSGRFRSLGRAWPVPALILIVLGGMFGGIFTSTEAGAAGALGALLVTLWLRRGDRPLSAVAQAAVGTVSATGAIFLLLLGAEALTRLMSITGLAQLFTNWVLDLGLGRIGFLLLMLVVYLILGTFLEPLALLLLTVPILMPTLQALDISLLWFGVFTVFMGELAVVSPPVGIVAFIIHGLVQDPEVNRGQQITLGDVYWASAWFLPACVLYCFILIFVPDLVTFLPELMGK
ncbi:TRAP transporter large permease subunit [Nocardioides humi]|uniref:TRAP transporter, DctM subunit n=1 Tax=Nocardioides humi TaxID=449461 RepID=A0ABN2BHR2_9ACTN|nr:TRAP transporter large permease subunit [Nocardioides humi]